MKSVIHVMVFALLLGGCGHIVTETLNAPQPQSRDAAGFGKTVVVLPFADYSQGDSINSAARRSMMITESITDKLTSNGFSLPVQEDVFEYLVAQRVINPISYQGQTSSSLSYELTGDWSDVMKKQIASYLEAEKRDTMAAAGIPGAHGLTATAIAKIGRQFGASYVIRGRILEFKTRDDNTWNPWQRGIIPFVMRGSNRILFGYADSAEYDADNASTAGMIVGATAGAKIMNWPNQSFMGIGSSDDTKAIMGAAVGSGLGRSSAGHAGYVPQAAVQIRMWVQEAATGNVIWTNRASVEVTPATFFADSQDDTLFNQAINECVSGLIDNFIAYGL